MDGDKVSDADVEGDPPVADLVTVMVADPEEDDVNDAVSDVEPVSGGSDGVSVLDPVHV